MKKDNFKYTVEELLLDAHFIASVLHPTPESREFWEGLIQAGEVSAEDFEEAALFVKKVQSRKEKLFRKEKEVMWKKIEIGNKKALKNKIHRLYITSISAAACILLLLGVSGYLFYGSKQVKLSDPIAQLKKNSDMHTGSDICLILSENEHMTFEENNAEVKYSKKGEVKVNSRTVVEEKIEDRVANTEEETKTEDIPVKYNQLIVPKGKHSTLLLSDGTKLWVNANSHVIFPVKFEKNKREIYVDGEAFLEVTRNDSCPFIVKTERMEVEVLGTSFNVNSYQHEENNVVLVTGSVHVKTGTGQEAVLSPNQRFSCTTEGVASIQTVDVYDYICWKDGLLRYRSESLSNILERLSHYYGKTIKWDPDVAKLKCSGKLDLKEDMEKVLNGLTRVAPVKFIERDGCYYFSINQ